MKTERTKLKTACPRCGKIVSVYRLGDGHFVSIHNPPLAHGSEELFLGGGRPAICKGSKSPVGLDQLQKEIA